MSFLSIVKTVGKGVKSAAPFIGPGIASLNPVAGAIFNGVVNSMTKAEQVYQDVPKSGDLKKDFTTSEFEIGLTLASEILAARGETLDYNKEALHRYIDAQAAALNALAELKASFNLKSPAPVPPVIEQAFR